MGPFGGELARLGLRFRPGVAKPYIAALIVYNHAVSGTSLTGC